MHLRPMLALSIACACGGAPECPPAPIPECPIAEAPPPVEPAPPTVDAAPVALDGCPEIGPELRARLNPYVNTRSASLDAIAPDGSSVLVLTRFAETAQIHEVDHPM